MTRIGFANTTAMLAALLALATAPAALGQSPSSGSGSGGAASPSSPSGDTGSPSTPSSAQAPTAPSEPSLVVASGAVVLRVQAWAMLGHTMAFQGDAPRSDAWRSVLIQRFDTARAAWVPAVSTTTDGQGRFLARWRTSLTGRIRVRAIVVSAAAASRRRGRSAASDSSGAAQVTVYRPAVATYFGDGFYGQQTACGQTMSRELVGVANRTLPCGTLVEVSYGGRHEIVPVIDRGPYANGADWDLTSAAASALGISETVHLGTLIVGRVPSTPSLGSPSPQDSSSGPSQPGASPSGGSPSGSGATGGAAAG